MRQRFKDFDARIQMMKVIGSLGKNASRIADARRFRSIGKRLSHCRASGRLTCGSAAAVFIRAPRHLAKKAQPSRFFGAPLCICSVED